MTAEPIYYLPRYDAITIFDINVNYSNIEFNFYQHSVFARLALISLAITIVKLYLFAQYYN